MGGAGPDSRIPDVGASWPSQAFGSLQFQAAQPQATTSQAMVSSGLPTLGSGRDWQPPQDQLGRFIPPGLVSINKTDRLHACRDGLVLGRLDGPMEIPMLPGSGLGLGACRPLAAAWRLLGMSALHSSGVQTSRVAHGSVGCSLLQADSR